ncbi:hypothetical protein vBAbaMPhT2_194 [Acinetobacter phage vB_AbaM_PhT2]|uniref:Uncharacterized protein n=1 Tax=Acinetobacter phage vB_AbaM_PhT2 TaxID=2690230 RepID=A0A6B9SY26_9CAUD|nr:hypothetical protein HYQ24_gp242 [Acinetobacter phage vB_AbaM_PhT2]QHJ75799.1 hypothetical protein vBAbaMPhT2_194 [Acinetobacter phage vB_AbaM_PhT2]
MSTSLHIGFVRRVPGTIKHNNAEFDSTSSICKETLRHRINREQYRLNEEKRNKEIEENTRRFYEQLHRRNQWLATVCSIL